MIRRARTQQREIDFIRAKLVKAENSGFVHQTVEEIRAEFKEELRRNEKL